MSDWQTVRPQDIKDEPARKGPHVYKTTGKIAWLKWCRYCGHVPLRNGISLLVSKIGCGYESDARYGAWVRGGRRAL